MVAIGWMAGGAVEAKCTRLDAVAMFLGGKGPTYLLHDTSLSLGEGDMATRLVLNELDLDLAPLATGLVIVIIVVVGSAGTRALDASALERAIAVLQIVVGGGRVGLVIVGELVGHIGRGWSGAAGWFLMECLMQ